jgi:hypothetical protein
MRPRSFSSKQHILVVSMALSSYGAGDNGMDEVQSTAICGICDPA